MGSKNLEGMMPDTNQPEDETAQLNDILNKLWKDGYDEYLYAGVVPAKQNTRGKDLPVYVKQRVEYTPSEAKNDILAWALAWSDKRTKEAKE